LVRSLDGVTDPRQLLAIDYRVWPKSVLANATASGRCGVRRRWRNGPSSNERQATEIDHLGTPNPAMTFSQFLPLSSVLTLPSSVPAYRR
jgi:hypothetical protein